MIKRVVFLLLPFLTVCILSHGQVKNVADSTNAVQKPEFQNGNLDEFLAKICKYPADAIERNAQGDVVVSFTIDKNSRILNVKIESSPDNSLSSSSLDAIKPLDKVLMPALNGGAPVDKSYLIVFRYRIYLDSEPIDYNAQALKASEKQKYDKALNLYDKAIKDNIYNFRLFESRAVIKEKLGDFDGANEDKMTSIKLQEEILTIVVISLHGVVRKAVMVDSQVVKVN